MLCKQGKDIIFLLFDTYSLLSLKEDPQTPSLEYSWHLVGVLDYSKEKCQYLVQKVHQNSRLTYEEGNPILNKEDKKSKPPGQFLYFCTIMILYCLVSAVPLFVMLTMYVCFLSSSVTQE